jgi:hypothetical protein
MIKYRRLRCAGHSAKMEEGRNAFRILKSKPIGMSLLGRPISIWEDNISMYCKGIGVSTRIWVD